jgi:hypothetical protein
MEQIMLWVLFFIGLLLFFFSLRKPPIKDWILMFMLSANITTFIGVFVERKNLLSYPVRFLSGYFDTNILYEYLWFPVVCIYFYQTTYQTSYRGIIGQGFVYSGVLTGLEVVVERYTDLLKYSTWTWLHTFISVFLLMLFLRFIMKLINWQSLT